MKKRIAFFVSLFFASSIGFAQDAEDIPRFLMFNQSIVHGNDMATVNQLTDSLSRPILDAMVDEGLIYNWGILTHNWGDEWNWNWYMFTRDHASFVAAWDEFVRRLGEAHPGAFQEFAKYSRAHKDNTYIVRHFRGRQLAEGEEPARFIMSNQSMVNQADLGTINALMDSVSMPVLDAMLDEGLIDSWGDLRHAWGDEWNVIWYMSAKNHAAFVNAWNELIRRLSEAHPGAFREMGQYVQAHRDNLYYIQYAR